jgi:hypothetical protein
MTIKENLEKFKNWYTGRSADSIFLNLGTDDIKNLVEFKPPCIARILNAIGRFWLRNWQYLVSTFITLIFGLLTLYIGYLKLIKTP